MDVSIKNNKIAERYEMLVSGCFVFLDYKITGQIITIIHTKVPKELKGQGLGGKIVKFALEDAKGNDFKVIPKCPFVKSYIERHAEYQDLVFG